jgi:hypothetical protein
MSDRGSAVDRAADRPEDEALFTQLNAIVAISQAAWISFLIKCGVWVLQ